MGRVATTQYDAHIHAHATEGGPGSVSLSHSWDEVSDGGPPRDALRDAGVLVFSSSSIPSSLAAPPPADGDFWLTSWFMSSTINMNTGGATVC